MKIRLRVLLVAFLLLPVTAHAQRLSGTLFGTVQDEQGGVLQGAAVRVSSPALIGGELTTTTNAKGQWRFPVLDPGPYVLTVDVDSFASYREQNIDVGAGSALERAIVLKLAAITATVVVDAGATTEARGSGFVTRVGPEYLRTIPTRRFSMFDAIKAAPGVSPTSPSGTVTTVSAFGSAVNENAFLIDGTNFTCPCQGVSRAEPSVDVIQEIQIQSIGASVEYGNIQGAVFNVITKQGSDRVQYDASYYAQTSSLTAQPVVLPVTRGTLPASGYDRVRYRDFTTNLGGPLLRDRLWAFGGYQYLRDYDSQPGTDPRFPRRYEQNKVFAKATWRISTASRLMTSMHEERWVNPTPPTSVKPFAATLRLSASVPSMTFGHLTRVLSPATVWEVRAGRFTMSQTNDPATGDRTTASRFDQFTGMTSGNPPTIGGLRLDRLTTKTVLNHYEPDLIGGDHDFRAGAEFERGENRVPSVIPGGSQFVDVAGAPFQAVYRAPSIEGGRFYAAALFASDSFTARNRVTVNAGMRFDHIQAVSQDLPVLDATGSETGNTVKGLGTLYTWNVLSPRLGVTAKLRRDGRTMLRASYGRFNQGVLTGELGSFHPGVTPTRTMRFDPATGDYTTLVSLVDPRVNLALNPRMRTPHSDEYSVGVDHQILKGTSAAVAYIRKRGTDYIAWTDVAGEYRQETRMLPDGSSLPVFVLTSPTSARRFLLTNPDGLLLNYEGVVLAVEKRMSHGWRAFGSYTFSRTSGLLASSGATADGAQLSTVAPTTTFGRDPNDLTNARGRLPNDRPHILRAMGTVMVPRTGLMLAANVQYLSGKPWSASAQVSLPQGSQRILLEPRGSRRLSSQMLLDMRLSRAIRFGSGRRVELLLDVLNLLNDTAEEAVATDNLFSPNFGLRSLFVDPRRAMLGVRVNLGR